VTRIYFAVKKFINDNHRLSSPGTIKLQSREGMLVKILLVYHSCMFYSTSCENTIDHKTQTLEPMDSRRNGNYPHILKV